MGFYSTKTSEEKRVKQLTGDIHLSEEFKEEIKNRDIPIYQGYNIQKRLRFEVEQGQLKGDEVDSRLMELLEENSKNNVSNIYTQEIKKDSDKCCRACGISDPLSGYADCFMYMVCRKNHVVLCYGSAARCFSGVSRCDRRMGKNKRNLGSNTIQKERSMKQTDITLLTI